MEIIKDIKPKAGDEVNGLHGFKHLYSNIKTL